VAAGDAPILLPETVRAVVNETIEQVLVPHIEKLMGGMSMLKTTTRSLEDERIAKGASAQTELDRLADELVMKSAGRLTHEQAVVKVLSTPRGARLYAEITSGDDARNEAFARRRLDPPPLPLGWSRPSWWPN
jgi:hypothetical protein